jgi:hypothetical protein
MQFLRCRAEAQMPRDRLEGPQGAHRQRTAADSIHAFMLSIHA